jgi:hypothetical protein
MTEMETLNSDPNLSIEISLTSVTSITSAISSSMTLSLLSTEYDPLMPINHSPNRSLFSISTSFLPQKMMPENCSHPIVEKYISEIEKGEYDFDTIPYHESIPENDRVIKTLDLNGNVIISPNGNPLESPVKYVWKQLCDHPIVIGITLGVKGDHEPHFHHEPECYYVVQGSTKTLCQNKYIDLTKGDYLYIPGDTIHNTPIVGDNEFSVLYWFPNHSQFSTFQYYWKKNSAAECVELFQKVDEIRQRDLQLGSYEQNI